MKKNKFKITILCIVTLGVSILMFGCGSKKTVNPLGDNLEYSYEEDYEEEEYEFVGKIDYVEE